MNLRGSLKRDQGQPQEHDQRSKVRAAGSMDTTISHMAKFAAAPVRGDGLGHGFDKGGHDGQTANTVVCIETSQRCAVILSNDVRSEADSLDRFFKLLSYLRF
jgi:hypothetical protein